MGFGKGFGQLLHQGDRWVVTEKILDELTAYMRGRGLILGEQAQGCRPFGHARALDGLAQEDLVRGIMQVLIEMKATGIGNIRGGAHPPAGQNSGQGLRVLGFLRTAGAQGLVVEQDGGVGDVDFGLWLSRDLTFDDVFPIIPSNEHSRMHGRGRQKIEKTAQGMGPDGFPLEGASPEVGQALFIAQVEMFAPKGHHEFIELTPRKDRPKKFGFGRFQGRCPSPVEDPAHGLGIGCALGFGGRTVFPEQAHRVHGLGRELGQGLFQGRRLVDALGFELAGEKGCRSHLGHPFQIAGAGAVGQARNHMGHLSRVLGLGRKRRSDKPRAKPCRKRAKSGKENR